MADIAAMSLLSRCRMKIEVLFFATLRDSVGMKSITVEMDEHQRVSDLKKQLVTLYPALTPHLETALVAVNHSFASDDDVIPEGAEVALFPPVSGGSSCPQIIKITSEIIDLNDLVTQIVFPATGAVCVFNGFVRSTTTRDNPHETFSLQYEAYNRMAEIKMEQIAVEIRQRWPEVQGIAIVQRIGRLNPGEPTVVIACSAAHRDSGVFEAARYGIDRLKEIVPVWKKEIGPHGEEWVEGNYVPDKDV